MSKYLITIEAEVEADTLQTATNSLFTITNPPGWSYVPSGNNIKFPLRIVRAEEIREKEQKND